MRKITLKDVKNLHEYELIRDDWRKDVIAVKAKRRVLLGDIMSLLFENRLTVLNLVPAPGELSATLLVEITEEDHIQPRLDGLVGLSSGRHVWLELNGRKIYARFLEGQGREDRIAAVQYLRFPIGTDPADGQALAAGAAPVALHVDHPGYRASVVLSPATRAEIAGDLVD